MRTLSNSELDMISGGLFGFGANPLLRSKIGATTFVGRAAITAVEFTGISALEGVKSTLGALSFAFSPASPFGF